jgi:hypothetical protein
MCEYACVPVDGCEKHEGPSRVCTCVRVVCVVVMGVVYVRVCVHAYGWA